MKRTIAVVTSSRADYGHLFWLLKELQASPDVDLRLIAIGPHLSPLYGNTALEIERDGFSFAARIECLLSSDTDTGMAKTLGMAVLGLSDVLAGMRPDILLLIADRYEMLAPACVALSLRIPIAHIEGGEVSEGAIDDAVRNSLTKMAHLHFTSTDKARNRVLSMGEEQWRVHRAGAPSLDHLRRSRLLTSSELEADLQIELSKSFVVVAYHPVTLLEDTTEEASAVFAALSKVNAQMFFCYPNADAGSYRLIQQARTFCADRPGSHLFVNLPPVTYWSLLREAAALIGNSSSGIMEAASLSLPVVNIGMRQHGRERAQNVLDAGADVRQILEGIECALSSEFRGKLKGMQNPYGDGHAAERIARVLTRVPIEKLLHKKAVDAER